MWCAYYTIPQDGVKKGNKDTYIEISYGNSYTNWFFGRCGWESSDAHSPAFGIDDFLVLNEEYSKYGVWQLYSTTHHGKGNAVSSKYWLPHYRYIMPGLRGFGDPLTPGAYTRPALYSNQVHYHDGQHLLHLLENT